MRTLQPIERRLRGSLAIDAINGDRFERSICASLMEEAAVEIEKLRAEIAMLRDREVGNE